MLPDSASTAVQRVALVASSGRDLLDLAAPLVTRLAALRHKPICLAADLDPAIGRALSGLGAEIGILQLPAGGLNPFYEFRARRQATAALKAHHPHTILAYDLAAASCVAPLARRAGCDRLVAALATIGEPEPGTADGISTGVERQLRQLATAATRIVVSSATDARALRALDFLAAIPVEVSPQRGVDLGAVPARPLPSSSGALQFIADASSLTGGDLATLTDAMARVARQEPSARLVIAGAFGRDVDPALVAALLAKAPSTTLAERDGALVGAIASAHAYVHAAAGPGLPSALLAALACGRAVVASDVGGAREAVDQVVNGILAKPGDGRALAEAMLGIVRRRDILAALGDASRRKAERRFDATSVNAALLGALGISAAFGSAA